MQGRPIQSRVVGLEQYVDGHRRLMEFVRRRGVRLSPNSRVVQYGHVLTTGKTGGDRAMPLDVHTAALEMRQLIAIADCLGDLPGVEGHFGEVLQGHYHTLGAPTHDPGRDKQFEMFVAARLARGGLRAELAEPDVVVDLGGERVGIAAKRPRTVKAIKWAVRDGRNQIRATGLPGFIAVDTSMYPLDGGHLVMGLLDSPADVARATASQLDNVVRRSWPYLRPCLLQERNSGGTAGLLLHLAVPFSVDVEDEIQMLVGEAWALLPTRLEETEGRTRAAVCSGEGKASVRYEGRVLKLRSPADAEHAVRRNVNSRIWGT